jgi:peptidoglycan/LPS O-acetylase OafA/YrhL
VPELDAVRGLAALAVVFFHLLPDKFYFGWMGVDVFFVLSGFLITRIILEGQNRRRFLPHFYARRILRIWPAYYMAVAAAFVLASLSRLPQPMGGLPYTLCFVQNVQAYWGGDTPDFTLRMGHTWTVAIEEQFYLVWPFLVGRFGRHLPRVVVALLLLAIVVRVALPRGDLLLARCDGLALGAGIAWYWQRRPEVGLGLRLAWVLLLILIVLYVVLGTQAYGKKFLEGVPLWRGPTILVVSLFAALLVTAVLVYAGSPALRFLRVRALVYVGKISFGLYLFHKLVFWIADGLQARFHLERSLPFLTAAVVSSILVAALSWELIERPILRLRSRFPV